MTTDMFLSFSFMTYHLKLNTTIATSGTGNAIFSGAHEFIPLKGILGFLSLALCGICSTILGLLFSFNVCLSAI
jgi:TM2 domain-containing membrane protein YozV